jgi:Zn ribbon nucleic-acid-binding protein
MEAKEPKWVGTMKQNENGYAIRFLAASAQFSTRSCARCAGLLVNEWYYDLDNIGEHNVEMLRCVQCGHRIDPVIVRNQILPPGRKPARTAGAAEVLREDSHVG